LVPKRILNSFMYYGYLTCKSVIKTNKLPISFEKNVGIFVFFHFLTSLYFSILFDYKFKTRPPVRILDEECNNIILKIKIVLLTHNIN